MIFRAEVLKAFFEGLFVRVTQGLEQDVEGLDRRDSDAQVLNLNL